MRAVLPQSVINRSAILSRVRIAVPTHPPTHHPLPSEEPTSSNRQASFPPIPPICRLPISQLPSSHTPPALGPFALDPRALSRPNET